MAKNLLKSVFVTVVMALLALQGIAQDIHFSQYYASPMQLNPALAGMNNCDYRIYANFRTQWVTVSTGNTYRTVAGGADMSIGKVTKYNSFAGLGISFFSDQAGDLNFNTNRIDLSFAYHFMLNRKGTMQISTGIQGAFNYNSINPSKATFDSQYDPTTGIADPNGQKESFAKTRVMFGDAGFGLLYSAIVKQQTNFFLGFALNHLNQPKMSFQPNGTTNDGSGFERLYMKITIHGGASLPVGKRLAIQPHFLALVQGPSYQFNLGCNFKTTLGNVTTSRTALHLGVQYRGLLDAVVLSTRIDVKGFGAGLSYDINVSKLTPASHSVGAPEVSIMYQGCARKKPHPGHCPALF
ncbi:MAG: PorP/SprF family type IX secretion system membrane protein [Chitinophagales bacterium]